MEIERNQLLAELQMVEGGVAPKETVEQSNCFVFRKGEVLTYNDNVACRAKSSLRITGAINANKMLNMLAKWPEETVTFKRTKGQLRFRGRAKRGYFAVEDKIRLEVRDMEKPKKWQKLPTNFGEAISQVVGCAKHGGDSPHLCCVHFTPKWIEACDGVQAGRYKISTPFQKSVLLKRDPARRIADLDMTSISETRNWVHFRNTKGLIVSCHKYVEVYPSKKLTQMFKTKGNPTTLPKGIKGMVDRLKVFIDDDGGSQWLIVEVESSHIKVEGKGAYGSQTERKKIKYKGEPIGFRINPQLFRELSDTYDKCEVSKRTIKIKKGKFQYMASLWVPDDKKEKEKKKKD
jgi:hypothetical protein